MKPHESLAHRRGWLRLMAFFVTAGLLWTVGELWSSRRLLFWIGLAVVFIGVAVCMWCVYGLQDLLYNSARRLYLRIAFRAARGACSTESAQAAAIRTGSSLPSVLQR